MKNVVIINQIKEKCSVIEMDNIPREGDIIYLQCTGYKVEKVCFPIFQNSTTEVFHQSATNIFVSALTVDESKEYCFNIEEFYRGDLKEFNV